MEDDTTLSDGQNLIMDKLSYRFHEPERYDTFVFLQGYFSVIKKKSDWRTSVLYKAYHRAARYSRNRSYYVKGLNDGEKGDKVYINGKKLKSDIYGITDYIDEAGVAKSAQKLGKDENFVWR